MSAPFRLDAPACAAADAPRAAPAPHVACRECGGLYAPATATAEFCGQACRAKWNNRRQVRGAELYDLVMAWRYDRKRAKALGLWRMVCRMTAAFHAEDLMERDGRPSFRDPRKVLEQRPWLNAVVVARNAAGNRRR